MFDMQDNYRKAIQSGRSKPIKLNLHQRKVWQMVCYQWTLTPFALQMNWLPVRVSGIRLPRLPYLQRSFVTLPSRRTIKPISALLIKRYQWEILTITSPQNQLILCIRVPQKDLCIATKPMFDFRIPKPKKRIATAKPLLTLVLFWTGKGHYRRYFYVRPVQKTVSKENCGLIACSQLSSEMIHSSLANSLYGVLRFTSLYPLNGTNVTV